MPMYKKKRRFENTKLHQQQKAIILFVTLLLLGSFSILASFQNICTFVVSKENQSSSNNNGQQRVVTDDDSFALALRESGGFFDDVRQKDWLLLKERVHLLPNHCTKGMNNACPRNPGDQFGHSRSWYQDNFEPDFTCWHERRIGGMGDGPKWVCDPHRLRNKNKDCLVYSVGSNGDFSFEASVLREISSHCEIHTFDPEITGRSFGQLAPPGVHYHNWGFVGKDDSTAQAQKEQFKVMEGNQAVGNFKTLQQSIQDLGHVGRMVDIFKIDCEGCEFLTYQEWFTANVTLRQILVEVHGTPPEHVDKFFTSLQENHYVTFHKEPNIKYTPKDQPNSLAVEYALLKLEPSFFEKH